MDSNAPTSKTMEPSLFSVERSGDITTLRFIHDAMAGVDLNRMRLLWDFLSRQQEDPSKVLLVDIPSGLLSPGTVDEFLQGYLESITSPEVGYALRRDLTREENALNLLAERLSSLDSFVVAVLRGEVDFPFLGIGLSCDYRIASDVVVFRNRLLDGGLPPCGAPHWHLSRFLGFGIASHLLTTGQDISAPEAARLGLVDDVSSSW